MRFHIPALKAIIFIEILALTTTNAAKSIISPETINTNDTHIHMADGKILHRDKRFLIFSGGGISKVILGFSFPVETRDNVNWRTLNLAYNFQAQYVPIPSVMFLWNRFSRSLIGQRQLYDRDGTFAKDLTRDLVYSAIEMFLDHKGKPGRQCMLKAICEAAEHPIERSNIFDEIVHLVLTPNEYVSDFEYVQAKRAGEFGANCAELYVRCRTADGLLENISQFI